ncbi:putative metallopeptidase, partial [Pseudomonas sp.]|uniref:putative metallopeptidase n=1 Tax=Pseudomonas sp. TaxID=306 RepID=UPI00258C2A34
VLWASESFAKQGRVVLGQAEQVMHRAGGWQKARMEQQMREWFGEEPEFIITLAADYCSQCSDVDFLRLVEHELMHVAQATDQYGAPKFTKEGMPKLTLRGHDVSEFVSIVERYGVGHPEGDLARMVEAAKKAPSVSHASIASACGTCLMRSA